VHNGIIENYRELRRELEGEGVEFYGQTDSEVAVNIFAKIARENPADTPILDLLEKFVARIEGAYALVFTDSRHPDRLFGAKRGSPLVLGFGSDAVYASSDSKSFGPEVSEFVTLEDGDIFMLARHDYRIRNGGATADRGRETPSADTHAPELGGYPHFMLKEIHEQPDTIRNVLSGRLDPERLSIDNPSLDELARRDIRRITIVASGTSSYAGLVGKYYFEHLAGIETDVCISPEFKYARPFVAADRLFVFVSQSGETADTLECLKLVKKRGGYTFGIVNVPGSSISRLTDAGLHTRAGAEVGVASTKAFTAQIATFLLMALSLGSARSLDPAEYSRILSELARLPDAIADTLLRAPMVESVARQYARYGNFFYLGRSLELAVAME
jgi:glutamine---fructose-6-phosphate transaminase (isomerizing)